MLQQNAQQDTQIIKQWFVRYAPLLISLLLISLAMSGVAGNITAQLLVGIILAQPLSVWLANHGRKH